MPRKTRNTRKKGPTATSAASKKTIAVAENTEGESLESLLDDFDIQSKTDTLYNYTPQCIKF